MGRWPVSEAVSIHRTVIDEVHHHMDAVGGAPQTVVTSHITDHKSP